MQLDDIVNGLWKNSTEFFDAIEQTFGPSQLDIPAIQEEPDVVADQPASLCSMMALSRTGLDGVVECFYASPKQVIRVIRRYADSVELLPLATIQVPTVVLVGLGRYVRNEMPIIEESMRNLPKGIV